VLLFAFGKDNEEKMPAKKLKIALHLAKFEHRLQHLMHV